jgi:indolepyruvate ferredoxin oxidoreductase
VPRGAFEIVHPKRLLLSVSFSLTDRYTTLDGEILASGVQALARVPVDQMRADRAAGRKTAAFISGYQGSPLAGYDRELQANAELLSEHGIVHRPALNEELGATAVMGSQTAQNFSSVRYEGVLGVWYGKAPGVDRAADALRHGNWAGTSRLGGVLVLAGDDPACKSSTLPSASEGILANLGLPVLYPGTVQDILDLGRFGVAMSRLCGLWVAMKIVTPVADASSAVLTDRERLRIVTPDIEQNGRAWVPSLSADSMPPRTVSLEHEVLVDRMNAAREFLASNDVNQMVVNPPNAWLGIVAGGFAFETVLKALRNLGLNDRDLRDLGVRLLKLRALHPLDRESVRELARGVSTVLVVEDKLPNLEVLVRDALYGSLDRPVVLGKTDEAGAVLVPSAGLLTPTMLSEPLRRVLLRQIGEARLAPARRVIPIRLSVPNEQVRTPFFCSGCPHNTSLEVPAGAKVGAGIGCHAMVSAMDPERRGEVIGITQMGGEGSQWIGIAPFVEDPHLFQNLGDGTFFHSGQLSIQAAIAARVNITFKLLYNSSVAMTGGQDATGQLSVQKVAEKLVAEGVKQIIITTEDLGRYRGVRLPPRTSVLDRTHIVAAQEELRDVGGVTVLIHDQQCAAEVRRDRKRGRVADPGFRVFIDHRVCEGCGDCGVKSNCLSLVPVETDFGPKASIDQNSCNIDASCIRGDCPSFLTVKTPSKGSVRPIPNPGVSTLDDPVCRSDSATIRMPGIGGTGVVTVSQILIAAAKIQGVRATSEDQTGLSQKAGPVVSTVVIGRPSERVDVLLAFDVLSAVTEPNVAGLDPECSVVVASTTLVPTGRMIGHLGSTQVDFWAQRLDLDSRSLRSYNVYVDAGRIVTGLFGDSLTANVFLMGIAQQAGLIPLKSTSILAAIALNGVAVEKNNAAFGWGRKWVVDRVAVENASGTTLNQSASVSGLEEFADDSALFRLLAVRVPDLTAYQNQAYADRYLRVVRRAVLAEKGVAGDGSFSLAVAEQLHRVMAYKDEYEVARLLLAGRREVVEQFGSNAEIVWNLHPPVLRDHGLDRKLKVPARFGTPALQTLSFGKRVRGKRLDPFGRSHVRRAERALISEYESLVDELCLLVPTNHTEATRRAGLIDMVRGYEGVKLANLRKYRAAIASLSSPDLH